MKFLLALIFLLQPGFYEAQKAISLIEAEQLMQKNNLALLAGQYNISASQAAVIQARIWEQPYFSAEFNAINPQEKKVFSIGNQGEMGFAVQQLIYLGGKKKNEIAFAKSNTVIAELQFEQLLRNLKYQLGQTFYSVFFDRQTIASLENQIGELDTLLSIYATQAGMGNISLKEVVRLQSLVLSLKNDKNLLVKSVLESQQTLSLLTGITEQVVPVASELELFAKYRKKTIPKDSLFIYAIEYNPDYLTAVKVTESQELFLKWQRSMAIPDLTAGASYDQRGGAFQNQVNLTLGIPIPLWNRNKGNLKIAEMQLKQAGLNQEYKKLELQSKVETYWQVWLQQQAQLNAIEKSVTQNLESVYEGMVDNFQKRNISMLEFTDFMESYNQTSIQVNEIKKSWVLAGMGLSYISNKEIF